MFHAARARASSSGTATCISPSFASRALEALKNAAMASWFARTESQPTVPTPAAGKFHTMRSNPLKTPPGPTPPAYWAPSSSPEAHHCRATRRSASPSSTSTPKRVAAPAASRALDDVLEVVVGGDGDAALVERGGEDVGAVAVEEGDEGEGEGEVALAHQEDAHAAVIAVGKAGLDRGALEGFRDAAPSLLPLRFLGVRAGVAALNCRSLAPLQRLGYRRPGHPV